MLVHCWTLNHKNYYGRATHAVNFFAREICKLLLGHYLWYRVIGSMQMWEGT